MVHTGHPSSGPRSGAASAPLLSAFLRPLSRKCHPACAERSRRERSNPRFRPCRKGSAFLRSSLATRSPRVSRGHSSLATIPFRIKSFADDLPLTPIESHLYKKQGRGWGLDHFPLSPSADKCATHSNARNPNLFMRLLHGSLDTPGVGVCLFPLRSSAHSASLRYPFPLLASPLRVNAGGPNEP
jgi:hypothetical protein